jgi:hypothetical protein
MAWLVADFGSLFDPSHRRGQPNYQKNSGSYLNVL